MFANLVVQLAQVALAFEDASEEIQKSCKELLIDVVTSDDCHLYMAQVFKYDTTLTKSSPERFEMKSALFRILYKRLKRSGDTETPQETWYMERYPCLRVWLDTKELHVVYQP